MQKKMIRTTTICKKNEIIDEPREQYRIRDSIMFVSEEETRKNIIEQVVSKLVAQKKLLALHYNLEN
jgi:hypothetical protein